MEDKQLQELEEFSLEDIIKEFSDHPQEDLTELPAEMFAEELETAEAEMPEVSEAAEQTVEETEEVPAAEPVEEPEEEVPAEPVGEESSEEVCAEEADPALCGDTIRLDSSELLKGVVHDAQPIDDEAEEAAAAVEAEGEEEEPAFSEN